MAVFGGSSEIIDRNRELFGFADDDEQGQKLAEIATSILLAYGYEEEAYGFRYEDIEDDDDDDVGMVVTVKSSDTRDYGIMINEILSATSFEELQEIVDVYADSMPDFARELAEICAKEYPNSGTLRFAC
jgi:hypothetical protein